MASTSSGREQCGGNDPARCVRTKRKKKQKPSRVRGSYSLHDKAKILMLIELGWKNCEIQKATGVPESTLRSIKKRKDALKKSIELAKKYYSDNSNASTTLMNEITERRRLISATEHMLLTWAENRLQEKLSLDSCMLREQALLFFHSLSKRHGIKVSPPFNASHSWLSRFKKRIGMGEDLGHSVGTKLEQPPTTPAHRLPTTVYHDIKEEPPSPPSEDPLAILPEEEAILRSVGATKITPQAVIPLDDQALISPPGIADHKVWVIDEEYAPHNSDSEATVSATPFNSDSGDGPENDFVGFEDEITKMDTEEEGTKGMSTTTPPPPPLQHHEATTLPAPPPQSKAITLDLSPRTPNSSSTPYKITRPQLPPHPESNKKRRPTLRHVRINRDRTSPPCLTSLNKEETSISQPPTFSDKATSMPENTPSLPSYIQADREGSFTPHIQSSERRTSTHLTSSSQDRTSSHHKQSNENRTSTQHTHSIHNRSSTHHTPPNENRTSTPHHSLSTQDRTPTHHKQSNENRTSTPHHSHSTQNKISTHPNENRTSTPHHSHSTHNRSSTHPNENSTSTQHTHSNHNRSSTQHTPSLKSPQTPIPMCVLYEDRSPQQQQHRTPTSQLTRPVEATQTDAVASELSCVPSVGRQQQALCPELQGRQTEEVNVHTRLAEVTLDNEMIKREILKEALLQKRLETAVQRQRALQSGVELSQLSDEPTKPSDEPSKCNDEPSKPSDVPAQPCGEHTQARDAPSHPSNGPTPKRSKKVRRLLEKVKLLDKCREGMSNGAVARLFNITKSTVRYTRKHEASIRKSLAACTPPSTKQVVQVRSSVVSQLENAVYVWINDQNMKRNSIDENDICAKAKSLYEKMTVPGAVVPAAPCPAPATHPEFRATKRWLLSFRRRFSVRNIKTSGKSASADHVAAAAFLRELERLIEEKGYRPEQVWNMDETVLYWKRMPARTLVSKGRRAARDRCALLLCANAAGHLTKPGLVYTSANPGPLRQKKKNLLPVHWMSHSQGCTTSAVVMDWARHCLLPEVQAYLWGQGLPRKFLLILDNALGHHQALEGMLEGVEVVFLPPNTSPLIQPLEQGIMGAFKACYTRRSMQRLQEAVDIEPSLSVTDYWRGFTIADCLVLLQETMRDLRPQTVNDCWSVLWPECAQDSDELTPQEQMAEAVRKTVELARLVGREGFADMEQGEVRQLLEEHSAALTDEELLEMVQSSQEEEVEEEEDTDGPPQWPALTLDKLGEAMRLTAQLNKYVCDMDPSMLRALMVVDNINQAVASYKKVFEDMKRKQRQSQEVIKIASASPPHYPSLTPPEPMCVVKMNEQPAPIPASQPDHDTSSSSAPGSEDDMDYTTPADEDSSSGDDI